MIRIATTAIRVGDRVRTNTCEGTVKFYRGGVRPSMVVLTEDTETFVNMTNAGSVELLSDLNGRTPCEPFGRW